MLTVSQTTAWTAAALFPLTALVGWGLRRLLPGALSVRMRPHLIIGYAVFAIAALHAIAAIPGIGAMNSTNLWAATLAMGGLALESFVGASLQAPGVYRSLLRRWHLVAFVAVGLLIAVHVVVTVVL